MRISRVLDTIHYTIRMSSNLPEHVQVSPTSEDIEREKLLESLGGPSRLAHLKEVASGDDERSNRITGGLSGTPRWFMTDQAGRDHNIYDQTPGSGFEVGTDFPQVEGNFVHSVWHPDGKTEVHTYDTPEQVVESAKRYTNGWMVQDPPKPRGTHTHHEWMDVDNYGDDPDSREGDENDYDYLEGDENDYDYLEGDGIGNKWNEEMAYRVPKHDPHNGDWEFWGASRGTSWVDAQGTGGREGAWKHFKEQVEDPEQRQYDKEWHNEDYLGHPYTHATVSLERVLKGTIGI